ncbi:MAG: alpha/beta hydrolase [Paracoccaceae bacterium]|nr:alpha/beta hydrolase [Paracoccaceae bacterium]MDG1738468.1 alpha/beta hydrolase [Paracoccaceae bacterium]MDG2259785.1 alpha/beta hydrolase [Paracoccaceae bacterium]
MIPVVFVHGFMGGSAQWDAQTDAFGDAPIIAVDLPGFGENGELDAFQTIENYADWVLEHLTDRGVDQFHLVGHSMGGMIAQEMVAKSPERVARLVLYGTGAQGVLPGRFETIQTSKDRAIADGAPATARRISATWFLDRENDTAYEGCAKIAERASMKAILSGLDAMNKWSGSTHLPKLDAKTLVIWGDSDRTYSWDQTEQLWRSISKASLAVIPNCAHAPHLEKTDLFNSIVSDYLMA